MHALMSARPLGFVGHSDLRVRVRVRDLYATHSCSIFPTFVYNPLVYCVVGALGLLDNLFPVLFGCFGLVS